MSEDVESPAPTCWDLAGDPPDFCVSIAGLWSWSLNYDHGDPRRPFPLFLDLVGFSADAYGCRVSGWGIDGDTRDGGGLGWVELSNLGDALIEWAERPEECEAWVRELLDAPED